MAEQSEHSGHVAYIIGNGPSRKSVNREALGQGVVYAANVRGMEMQPDVLHCNDPWIQYDVIKHGYRGVCHFLDWQPIPIEMPWQIVLAGQIPVDYDQVVHNPEHAECAVAWHFYCTAELGGWSDKQKQSGYWRENRAYICLVPDFMQITHIPKMERLHSKLAPSGAYLMVTAIKAGHKRLEMYGFDSMAGEFHSVSTIDYRGKTEQEVDKQQGESFLRWYNKIMQENTDIEFIWHTNE